MTARALSALAAMLPLLSGGCATPGAEVTGSPLVGQPVDVVGEELGGRAVRVSGATGQVRVVDVWATWCEACGEELAALARLQGDDGRRGLAVYALSIDEDRAQVATYVAGLPAAAAVGILWDQGGARNAERLPLERLPTTLVVDRDGLIRHVHQGFGPGSAARLAAEVEALLGPAPVSSPVAPLPAVPPPAGPGRP